MLALLQEIGKRRDVGDALQDAIQVTAVAQVSQSTANGLLPRET